MTDRNSHKVVLMPNAEEISEDAALWFSRLRNEAVTAETREAFTVWLEQSERHRAAFAEVEAIWGDARVLEELADHKASALALASKNASWLSRRRITAVAASIAVAFVGAGMFGAHYYQGLYDASEYATALGEQQSHALADGSIIELNTASRLRVDYSPEARVIYLDQGEAHFNVKKSKRRPFTVITQGGAVRAVGTAFSVRVREREVLEVTVAEGRVALLPAAVEGSVTASVGPQAELTAGQGAHFKNEVTMLEEFSSEALERKFSWRSGVLAYSNESLADVIADMSRYTTMRIEIVDPATEGIAIYGRFRVGETEALFETLETNFGLTVERVSENYARIRRAV